MTESLSSVVSGDKEFPVVKLEGGQNTNTNAHNALIPWELKNCGYVY